MPDYSFGKVYKIINSVNDIIYIGTTCGDLNLRMINHRSYARTGNPEAVHCAMREIGIDKFTMVWIEDYPCHNYKELADRSYKYMNYEKSGGTELYNQKVDGYHCKETLQKMRKAQAGKVGAKHHGFKRGCIMFKQINKIWVFQWRENYKTRAKGFSVSKYGDSAAHAFALIAQDKVYPKVDNDQEFIAEIRAHLG